MIIINDKGWAYLKRRSEYIGEFNDVDDLNWEELMDTESLEKFYWQEDENLFSWIKPDFPTEETVNQKELIDIGRLMILRTQINQFIDGFIMS
jgi:hypothetical protein